MRGLGVGLGLGGHALEVLRIIAILASPAMRDACDAIWTRIGLDATPRDQRLPGAAAWVAIPVG